MAAPLRSPVGDDAMIAAIVSVFLVVAAIVLGDWIGRAIDEYKNRN